MERRGILKIEKGGDQHQEKAKMRITMNMAASKQEIDTEIGTLQFRKTNEGWEIVNKTEGSIIGHKELEILVDMTNNQINTRLYFQSLGFKNAPKNYARKVGK